MTRLEMFRGDDESFDVSVYEVDGTTPVDLTGATLRFTAKRRVSDADLDAVIELTTDDGTITVTNAGQGKARLDVPAAQTFDLTRDLRLLWDLQITDIADKVRTVATGDLIIRRDVTRTVP
jgi:hypothetical protein